MVCLGDLKIINARNESGHYSIWLKFQNFAISIERAMRFQ